jgi:TonB family protein
MMSDLEFAQKPSRWLWIVSAIGAVAIHAGCVAFAIAHMHTDDSDDDLGSPAIEVGLVLSSPRSESSDLPPGPDTEASTASPAVTEQKAVEKETELPKATPTETEDPDRVVTPDDSRKPKDDDSEPVAKPAAPSTESVASEATAMPTSEVAQEAPKSTAPAIGTGESLRRIRTTWQKQLIAHLDKHKRYPAGGERKTVEILVNFVLDRTGHVVSTSLVKSSGDPAFDNAALAMVRRSDPVPAPPPLVADEGLSFTLPVIFRVKGHG